MASRTFPPRRGRAHDPPGETAPPPDPRPLRRRHDRVRAVAAAAAGRRAGRRRNRQPHHDPHEAGPGGDASRRQRLAHRRHLDADQPQDLREGHQRPVPGGAYPLAGAQLLRSRPRGDLQPRGQDRPRRPAIYPLAALQGNEDCRLGLWQREPACLRHGPGGPAGAGAGRRRGDLRRGVLRLRSAGLGHLLRHHDAQDPRRRHGPRQPRSVGAPSEETGAARSDFAVQHYSSFPAIAV